MNTNRTRVAAATRLLVLAAGAIGTAGAASAAGPSDVKAAAAKPRPAAEWTTVPAKANGSGIRLRYVVSPALQPGQMGSVRLEFSGVGAQDARVEWRPPAGSSWRTADGGASTSMRLAPGQTSTVVLEITPAADGMAYLDVFTAQGGRASAHSIPLKVGSGAVSLKREGTLQTMPGGEKVISLPSTPK